MNLNMSQFRKIKEDNGAAVFKHPEGHEIRLAKKTLSPKHRSELDSIPLHLADGDEVPEEKKIDPAPAAQQTPEATPQDAVPPPSQPVAPAATPPTTVINIGQPQAPAAPIPNPAPAAVPQIPHGATADWTPPAPAAPTTQPQTPNPQVMNDPYGTQAYYDTYSKGIGQAEAGIAKQAEAEGAAGNASADVLHQNIQTQQAQMKTAQDHYNELDQERKNLISDIQNKHVDPNRFMNSMGTGQRVRTAIGLILGGMGGGLTHQGNPVLGFLNDQINRDIDAQKVDIGKSENLLSMNLKQFGNLKDATDMTRIMQGDIIANQLKEEAAKAQDPLSKARALQAAGQLEMQAAPVLSQIAMRRSILGNLQNGKMEPSSVIRMIVPEHEQGAAYKELGEAQEQVKARNNALGTFDEISKINSVGNRLSSPLQSKRQVEALRDNLAVQLARAAAGRVNDYEFEAAKKFFPQLGDNEETLVRKRQQLMNFVQEKMNAPVLKGYGIDPFQQGNRFGEQGQKKIQLLPPQVANSGSSNPK